MHFFGQNTAPFELLAELSRTMRARKVPCVSKETGYFLYLMMKSLAPKRVLEIGTATGVSTVYIAAGLDKEAHITTLEKCARDAAEAKELFATYGISGQVTQVAGDAVEILGSGALDGPFDVVFIDAMKRQYGEYMRLVRPLLAKGAVIFCDDVILFKHKMDDFYNLIAEWGLEGTIFPTDIDDGIMMLVLPTSC